MERDGHKIVGPSPEEAEELNRLRGPIRKSFLNKWGVLFGSSTTAALAAACAPQTAAAVREITPTSTPELTAIPTPTLTPEPTATAEPTATLTPESVKKPENFLPEYSVFYGEMKREDGTATGSVIAAHIPSYPNHIYVFGVANRSGQGYLYEIEKTDGKSLEAVAGWRVGNVYVTPTASQVELGKDRPKMNITLEDAKTLVGSYKGTTYEMRYYGKGKDDIIEAAKKLWAKEILNDPALWNLVSKDMILTAGFRGIELP